MTPRLILVGRVTGAFGVRGELKLTSFTEDPLALRRYGPLLNGEGRPVLTLTAARLAKPDGGGGPANALVARAAEVADRDAAEALRGLDLHVLREALPPPDDEDDFYHADLIGLWAVTPEGDALGVVKAVLNHGAGDLLELDPQDGRPTLLIPFTRAAVPEVRVGEGRVVCVPPVEDSGEPEAETPARG